MKTRAALFAVAFVSTLGVLSAGSAFAAGAIGQVVTPGARVDGTLVPSGATLFDPTSLATTESGVVVHLSSSRRALQLADHTQARLSSLPSGGVQVAVLAGALSYLDDDGSLITIAEDENAILDPGPQEGVVGEGRKEGEPSQGAMAPAEEEEVEVCELLNEEAAEIATCKVSPDDSVCEWKLIEVEESAVPALLSAGSRLRQDLIDNFDRDCDRVPGALVGLGALFGSTVGAGAFAIVSGGQLPPASPIQP